MIRVLARTESISERFNSQRYVIFVVLVLFMTLYAEANAERRALPKESYASTLLSVEQLPRFRPVAQVGAFTTYDRSGGNDDGFSGKHSYLRKEGDARILAEVEGAGAITRIHMPEPSDAPLEFYFDGETTPSLILPFEQIFTDNKPPFVKPLTGHALGGYYSYVPIEFSKSIKIATRSERLKFYQINYVVYRPGVPARTFEVGRTFTSPSVEATGATARGEVSLAPGRSETLWERSKPGRITSLKLGPSSAFAGKERDILLRVYWDGSSQPAINVPVGDLFGYSFGRPATQSLLFGTTDDTNYSYFPMPFEKSARIELVSERKAQDPVRLRWELTISDRGKEAQEGYFHAAWRRENPTVEGQPFTYLDVTGRGHVVGTVLQAQGFKLGSTEFFEGDDQVIADARLAINGVGSEDAFNGGWYSVAERWNRQRSLPFSGCLEYNKALARTGGYRVFLSDAYSFERSLSYRIEHGGEGNKIPTDYVGTTLFYLDRPDGTTALPSVQQRGIVDPGGFSLEFVPSPPPIIAMQAASVKTVRPPAHDLWAWAGYASFALEVIGPSGFVPSDKGTDFGSFIGPPALILGVDVATGGKYEIWIDAFSGPQSAMLQLRADDDPVGEVVDFYSEVAGVSSTRKLGELYLAEGKQTLHLTMPGKNSLSTGNAVDIVRIRGQRLANHE